MIGVALEGGGARGSYQIGALKALKKCGIRPSCYVGTSIGAVNAALAVDGDFNKMENIWLSMKCEDLFNVDVNLLKALKDKKINKEIFKTGVQTVFGIIKNAGIDTTKLKSTFKSYLDEDKIRKSNVDFGLVTYSLSDKKAVELFKDDIPKGKMYEYLIASCYLPVFKMEKIIDDKYYLDGGFHDNCPINMLLRKGYDEIYAIRTHSIGMHQKLIKNNAKIIYIAPKKKLGSILLFDEETIKENANLGFYDTLKVLKNLDGNKYYFRKRDENYYKKVTNNVNKIDLLMFEHRVKTEKNLVIKIIEKLCIEYNINVYNLYNMTFLIIRIKNLMKNKTNHKYYDFVKSLKIVF